jgi:hypothetical protein
VLGSPRPRRARQAKPPGATPTPTLEERIKGPRRATGPKTVRACGRLAWQRQHEVAAQRREGRASDAYAAAAGRHSAQVRHRHRPLHRPQRLHKVPPDPGEPPCRVTVDDARSPGQSDCLIPPGPLASLRTQPARPSARARLCGAASSAPLPAVTRSNPVPACDSGSSLHTHGRLGAWALVLWAICGGGALSRTLPGTVGVGAGVRGDAGSGRALHHPRAGTRPALDAPAHAHARSDRFPVGRSREPP